jgi:hypothetical protein
LIAVSIGLMAGAFLGYYAARLGPAEKTPVGAAEATFRERVEAYAPTCSQLSQPGRHGPLTLGTTTLYVRVQEDYFYVVGLETPAGGPPMAFWWGAGRDEARRQACRH